MLSVVIDTNVFIQGLLGSSLNRRILQLLKESKFSLIISSEIFDELLDVISRPKFRTIFIPETIDNLIEIIKTEAKFVNPTQKVTACRDTEDQRILECALEGADIVVSNDKDLLILKSFCSIPIISSQEFLSKLKV
ncbi:MAG: putative toxin-antitoxin system toxin component, PIN family [Candidatus Omnitrophica bacterium]|nr:putative toxin-antitoxin system toxin component, PIN family [Candidatus Omnitrophota bacterium]